MLFEGVLITKLSGKLDGLVASHNRGGAYFRTAVVPVDPHTDAQVVMRDGMSWVYTAWNAMDQTTRDRWEAYALRHPLTNRIGHTHTISGYAYWTRWALPRWQATEGPLAGGEVGEGPPLYDDAGALQSVSVTWHTSNTVIRIAWLDNPFQSEDHDYLMLHLATPRAPTINWFRGPFRLLGGIAGDPDSPIPPYWDFTLPSEYRPLTDQKLFWRLRFSREDYDLAPEMTGTLIGP